jgi:branched-chain amino acid transport system substrate-binding protein
MKLDYLLWCSLRACFVIISMQATLASALDKEILIGQSADFSGPQAASVKEMTDAARAYFDMVNKKGGVNGNKIKLISLDDGFDAKRTVENAKILLEKNVLMVGLGRGAASAQALMPIAAEDKIPMIGFVASSLIMHTPPQRYFFNLRPPFRLEAESAVRQLFAQGLSTIATVYSEDAFGKDTVEGVFSGLKAVNLTTTLAVTIPRGDVNVDDAVKKLATANANAVIGICIPKVCASIVKGLRTAGYRGQFVSLSSTSSDSYVKALGVDARGVIVTQVFPDPRSQTKTVSKNFQKLAEQYKLTKSYTSMEGFITAAVMVGAIKRAGPKPSREAVVSALESFNPLDLGGYYVSFSTQSRTGSQAVDLTMITTDGKFIR